MKFNKYTIWSILIAPFIIQLIIITYNNYTGFIHINSSGEFLIRLIISSLFSIIFAFSLIYLDFLFINHLNKKFSSKLKSLKRFTIEFVLTLLAGLLIGTSFTLIAKIFFNYSENIYDVLIINNLLAIIINLVLVIIIESISIYNRGMKNELKAKELEKENALIKLEILKNQIDPHFLFNSLNTLSALISSDEDKSQKFLENFSSIYRYILDVIDKPVISLLEEIEFAKKYIYLMNIRFDSLIRLNININNADNRYYLPPLAVQLLLENVVKHNIIADDLMNINIFVERDLLHVTNDYLPKSTHKSHGLGLSNLIKRYSYISEKQLEFEYENKKFIAKIPLLKSDEVF